MERPRVKPHVAIVLVSPGNVLVRGPALFVRYSGDAVAVLLDVVRLLDGDRTVAQVVRESGHKAEDVLDVLETLTGDKVLEDAAEVEGTTSEERAQLDPQLQLFSHLTTRPAAAQQRLREARVVVLGDGRAAATVTRLLRASGAQRVEAKDLGDPRRVLARDLVALIDGADHVVLALEAPYRVAFLAMNEATLSASIGWTALMMDGPDATIGPTVVPRQSACWRCYDLRAKGAHPNMERLLAYEAHAPLDATRPVGLAAFSETAAGFAAQAVVLTISGTVVPPLAGRVVRLSLLDLRATPERVLRMPRCPACSRSEVPDVDRYALEPVDLP